MRSHLVQRRTTISEMQRMKTASRMYAIDKRKSSRWIVCRLWAIAGERHDHSSMRKSMNEMRPRSMSSLYTSCTISWMCWYSSVMCSSLCVASSIATVTRMTATPISSMYSVSTPSPLPWPLDACGHAPSASEPEEAEEEEDDDELLELELLLELPSEPPEPSEPAEPSEPPLEPSAPLPLSHAQSAPGSSASRRAGSATAS